MKRGKVIRWVIRGGLAAMAIAVLVGAFLGLREYINYPSAPDPAKVEFRQALEYMGGEEFNRLYQSHRKQFAMTITDRLNEMEFADLLAFAMNPANRELMRKVGENMRNVEGHEEVGARMLSLFLEKFYQLPPQQRVGHLTMLALVPEGSRGPGGGGGDRGLPSLERFKESFTRFVTRQTPRTQAMAGQFMLDLRRQREILGLPVR